MCLKCEDELATTEDYSAVKDLSLMKGPLDLIKLQSPGGRQEMLKSLKNPEILI